MVKVVIFISLFFSYVIYSLVVYTKGTENNISFSGTEKKKINSGKALFQKHNCISCHQLYGLGGYLGPELTTAYTDKYRGDAYMRAFLKNGGPRMPKFNFTEEEIDAVISYLKYIDSTAVTYK